MKYWEVVTDKPVENFFIRFLSKNTKIQALLIISPFMTSLLGTRVSLDKITSKIRRERILTYVITHEPEDKDHIDAIDFFTKSSNVEVRFNQSLHAKLYLILQDQGSIAMLGSANLTNASIEKNIEIGMLIYDIGPGKHIIRELYQWGAVKLRTLKESRLFKKMDYKRRV